MFLDVLECYLKYEEESNGKRCISTKRGGTEDNPGMVERSRGRTTQRSPPSCPRTTSMSGQGVASKAWRGDGLSQPHGEGTFP
uniref:Uncharacterized protein n=1 Tax=Zea mays TaxID=4577 RepID=A0A804RGJ1_MAIZE